jgi:hypothetical protein
VLIIKLICECPPLISLRNICYEAKPIRPPSHIVIITEALRYLRPSRTLSLYLTHPIPPGSFCPDLPGLHFDNSSVALHQFLNHLSSLDAPKMTDCVFRGRTFNATWTVSLAICPNDITSRVALPISLFAIESRLFCCAVSSPIVFLAPFRNFSFYHCRHM